VGWLVEANISAKHVVSIFRADVMSWDCVGPLIQNGTRKCLAIPFILPLLQPYIIHHFSPEDGDSMLL
jgi:hypothetical protein